jgi:hypothetical protein
MYIAAAVILVLLIILAGVNLLLAQYNADELSNMGVEKR